MAEFPKNPEQKADRVVSLHEGAVSRQVPWLLTETQAVHVENLIVDTLGVRKRRDGAAAFGGIRALPGGMGGYNDGVYDEYLTAAWGNSIYKSDGDGGWAQIASGASLISGLLHQFQRGRHNGELAFVVCTCEEATDVSPGILGRSKLVVYDIANDTDTQVSLAPRTVAIFQNRLFYGEQETVGWSEIGDLASYSDANNLLVEPGLGGEITAILPARDIDPKMWIFKEDAIFLFTPRWGTNSSIIPGAGDALDTINSSIRVLSQDIGCVATKSAAWVPGAESADVFFLAHDGVRSLNRADNDVQTGAGFPISYAIPDWINRINFTHAHKAVAAVFDNAYHLAVPLDGAKDNTHVLRYDIASKGWSLHTWEARDLSQFRIAQVDRLWMQNIFAAGDTSSTNAETNSSIAPNQIYSLYSGDFDPSTDVSNVQRILLREDSRAFTLGDPLVRKRWDRLTMSISTGDTCRIEVQYKADLSDWATTTDFIFSGAAGSIVFGIDPLPWTGADELIRRRSISLSHLDPSYSLQIRLRTPTGATEPGALSTYFTEVSGHLLTNDFANDNGA